MNLRFIAGMLALLVVSAGIASADIVTWSYTSLDDTIQASGTALVTNEGGGTYLIDTLSGERNGKTITFVPNPSFSDVDNVFVIPPDPGLLTNTQHSGFAFSTTDGEFNPFYSTGSFGTAGNYYEYPSGGGNNPGPQIDFSASVSAPDGGTTLMLLGGAFAGLAALRRKLHA